MRALGQHVRDLSAEQIVIYQKVSLEMQHRVALD